MIETWHSWGRKGGEHFSTIQATLFLGWEAIKNQLNKNKLSELKKRSREDLPIYIRCFISKFYFDFFMLLNWQEDALLDGFPD